MTQALPTRSRDQFRRTAELQLFFDAIAEGMDGGNRQLQDFGNLAGGFAFSQHLKHFQLAVAQLLDRRQGLVRFAAQQFCQDRTGHFFAEKNLPGKYFENGRAHDLNRLVFHDVTLRPGAQGAFGIKRLVVHRDDQYRQVGVLGLEALGHVNSVCPFKRDVHQHEVRLEFRHGFDGPGGVGNLAANRQGWVAVNDPAKALAKQGMIVHDQDSALLGRGLPHIKRSGSGLFHAPAARSIAARQLMRHRQKQA
jgi:hypothetical protein